MKHQALKDVDGPDEGGNHAHGGAMKRNQV